ERLAFQSSHPARPPNCRRSCCPPAESPESQAAETGCCNRRRQRARRARERQDGCRTQPEARWYPPWCPWWHPCTDGCRRLPSREDPRSEEHTSELQSRGHLVCRLLLEKKKP